MDQYLSSTEIIDWKYPAILSKAESLAGDSLTDTARRCFEFVRDEILHSYDHRLNPVTCRASEVLQYGTGYCYAKSHLLAALLRASGIPAGMCYQRLGGYGAPGSYCLHGLNAVYLPNVGWYRIDARGNKPTINAHFSPPVEQLAFLISDRGESDIPGIWSDPLPAVVEALWAHATYDTLADHLPDLLPEEATFSLPP
jgi:transglutaminase-like putative cysteine protease